MAARPVRALRHYAAVLAFEAVEYNEVGLLARLKQKQL